MTHCREIRIARNLISIFGMNNPRRLEGVHRPPSPVGINFPDLLFPLFSRDLRAFAIRENGGKRHLPNSFFLSRDKTSHLATFLPQSSGVGTRSRANQFPSFKVALLPIGVFSINFPDLSPPQIGKSAVTCQKMRELIQSFVL